MSNISNKEKTLGIRFLDAYNTLDKALRVQYNFKVTISFSDLIRRCADLNQIIRGYENQLINFARLRNAIIHNSDSSRVIAEPHITVVELMEKICALITRPPLAMEVINSKSVLIIDAQRSVADLIKETGKSGYGVIPAYKGSTLIGVVRWRKLIEDFGNSIIGNGGIDQFIINVSIEEYLRTYPQSGHFAVVSAGVTVEEILTIFDNNRKLSSILITKTGTAMEKPIGIITNSDIMDLVKKIKKG